MGLIFVTASPSAGGKTTINRRLIKTDPGLALSISFTSRSPRKGEREGHDYYFVSESEFKKKIREGDFVEYARVHGSYYGTSISKLSELMESGFDVLLEIDVQGARQIKEKYPESCLIFILPPNFEVLSKRLQARQTETGVEIEVRLRDAKKELEEVSNYDYIVVNDDLEDAVNDMKMIIGARRRMVLNNQDFLKNFFVS